MKINGLSEIQHPINSPVNASGGSQGLVGSSRAARSAGTIPTGKPDGDGNHELPQASSWPENQSIPEAECCNRIARADATGYADNPPRAPSRADSNRNCMRMSRRRAPTALRRPISRVRSRTDISMTASTPMPRPATQCQRRSRSEASERGPLLASVSRSSAWFWIMKFDSRRVPRRRWSRTSLISRSACLMNSVLRACTYIACTIADVQKTPHRGLQGNENQIILVGAVTHWPLSVPLPR